MIYSKILNIWEPDEELIECEEFNREVLNPLLIVADWDIIYVEEYEEETVMWKLWINQSRDWMF